MSIPASQIVTVNPGVIGSGGNSLALNGLFLTQNSMMPVGKVYNFANAKAVGNFFGFASDEYSLSLIYFAGYVNSTVKPSGMLFSAFNAATRAAYLQSGSLASLTLTQLKALTGVLTLTLDGTTKTSATINLSTATSFSNAATLIAAGFTNGPAVAWNPISNAFVLTSATTGAGSNISFATGSLATGLNLNAVGGALTSQGSIADTPATAMSNAVALAQNFVTFTTLFEPDIPTKTAFAIWSASQNSRFMYVAWDTDNQAVTQGSQTCFGYLALQAAYDGMIAVSGDTNLAASQGTTLAASTRALATFVCATVASIDFSRANGRITAAFKSGSALLTTVEDAQLAANLIANGYSYYGGYATANTGFRFFYNGALPGEWLWLDNFVDQVYLNSQLQLALLNLVTNAGSVGYNDAGFNLIRSAMLDPIRAALNFGSIRTGVALSEEEIAQVNQLAGTDVSGVIQTQGYYLQILDPGSQARSVRQTPVINLFYTDGSAVQQISVASIDIF